MECPMHAAITEVIDTDTTTEIRYSDNVRREYFQIGWSPTDEIFAVEDYNTTGDFSDDAAQVVNISAATEDEQRGGVFSPLGIDPAAHFFHVRGCQSEGADCDPWSEIMTDRPVLTKLKRKGSRLNVLWTSPFDPATTVTVQWSTSPTFESIDQVKYATGKLLRSGNIRLKIYDSELSTPLISGETYYYRIQACWGEACGSWSESLSTVR